MYAWCVCPMLKFFLIASFQKVTQGPKSYPRFPKVTSKFPKGYPRFPKVTQGSQWIPKVPNGYPRLLKDIISSWHLPKVTQGCHAVPWPCIPHSLVPQSKSPIPVPNPSPQSQSPVPVPSPSPSCLTILRHYILVHFYESTPSWLKVIGGVAYVILESAQVFVFWP